MVAESFAAIALGLLAASGMVKLVDPDPTTGAMRSARLPSGRIVTYGLGMAELLFAGLSLTVGGWWLVASGLLYASFAIFTFAALRNRIPVQSCGCFGREDTPPNGIHVAYNLLATAAIGLVTLQSGSPIDWAAPASQLLLYVGFAAIGVACSYLLLARLPQLMAQIENV